MNVILGFVVIALLGFIGSRLTLFRSQFSIGMQFITLSGTEFLFVGFLLGPWGTNLITETALRQLAPVFSLGLGWIGLIIGLQFDRAIVKRISAHIWKIGLTISSITFLVTFLFFYLTLDWLFSFFPILSKGNFDSIYLNPIAKIGACVILGWVASESTNSALALLKQTGKARGEAAKLLQYLSDIRNPIAILAMGIWYCFFHVSRFIGASTTTQDSIDAAKEVFLSSSQRFSLELISYNGNDLASNSPSLWSDLGLDASLSNQQTIATQ